MKSADQYSPDSDGSLSTCLPLKFLESLISERRLPLKGFGLMTLIFISSDDFATTEVG